MNSQVKLLLNLNKGRKRASDHHPRVPDSISPFQNIHRKLLFPAGIPVRQQVARAHPFVVGTIPYIQVRYSYMG